MAVVAVARNPLPRKLRVGLFADSALQPRCARPAGRLYWRNGALYRPAQICVPRAGAGVALNRVLRLTPHDYAERQVGTIPGIRGVNHGAELTVVDAFARRSRFA